ncbi:MAG TPA: hypothetical protein VII94_00315 [Candidatus Saccharimonadales bacterium]
MNIEDLEEALADVLPGSFSIETNKHGHIIIHTSLIQDEDGELVPLDSEEDEEGDPDLDPLEDDDEEDD